MRKFLSLVLALVMMMSLVTINAGAKEFTDDSDITYQEAVDVISTIKVVDGYDNGSYNPKGNLTRGAAAKIICNLILGPTTAAELHADTAPFRDVPVTHDFAGYIAYCQKEGIISGYADGSFRPAGTLTGYAFMKMLLGALGYDAEIEGFVGPNWSINVAKKAIGIGLNKSLEGEFNGVNYITREEAALYAFNTLRTDLVEYDQKITASVNGAEVTVGNSLAKAQTWNNSMTRHDNIRNDAYIQFAEQYFNKLVLKEDVDSFGRPDREWKFDGDDIGSYINYDLFKQEYTTEVSGKDLYDLLGSRTVDEYDFQITIDGVDIDKKTGSTVNKTVLTDNAKSYFDETFMAKTYKSKVGQTGNGVLTQVFVDNDKTVEKVWVSVINTYLAKATADYSEKKDEASFDVFALDKKNSDANAVYYKFVDACKNTTEEKEKLTITSEDFDRATEVKKDDIVLVRVANGEIKEIIDPEVLSASTLTAFSKDKYVETDGDKYDYNTTVEFDVDTLDYYTSTNNGNQELKNTEYDVYLDPYNFLIGIKIVEATNNYIFLTGIDQGTSNLKNKTADAAGILTDGTFIEFAMDMKDSKQADGNTAFEGHPLWNTWCTYTVDKNNVYTLKEVKDFAAVNATNSKVKAGQYHDAAYGERTINDKHVSLRASATPAYVYGNDKSIYIVAELERIASDTEINAVNGNQVTMPDTPTTSKTCGNVTVGENVGIISGVDSIGVGIANVDLVTWNKDEIDDEIDPDSDHAGDLNAYPGNVYTLFDNKGYVIAAVVVGEDNGTNKVMAYSHKDSISKERYSSADDEWTWERLVIINGEEVTLTEKGSKISALEAMTENTWYEIAYKADGTVKSATHAWYKDSGKNIGTTLAADQAMDKSNGANEGEFVDNIDNVEWAINESNKTVVLYEETWGNGTDAGCYEDGDSKDLTGKGDMEKAPSLIESTLYVDTANKRGFYVSKDVKTVLIQKNDGQSTTEYGEGTSDLEDMLDDLNYVEKANGDVKTYLFKISAILTNGRATTVIIHDWVEGDAKGNGGSHGSSSGSSSNTTIKGVDVSVNKTAGSNLGDDDEVNVNVTKSGELTISVPVGVANNNSTADVILKVNGVDVSYKLGSATFVNGNLVFDTTNLDLEEGDVVEVIVEQVIKAEKPAVVNNRIGAGVTAGDKSALDDTKPVPINDLQPGVYQFPTGTGKDGIMNAAAQGNDIAGRIEENLFFRFNITESIKSRRLEIKNSDGVTVYTEKTTEDVTFTGPNPLRGCFYVQVLDSDDNTLGNKGDGYMKTQPLPADTYYWSVIIETLGENSVDKTVGSGTFVINPAQD